jgi:hypothetical protein
MDDRTLEALKASIAKWERNAVAETPEDVRVGGRECPLCVLFNEYLRGANRARCVGCPVADHAGIDGCLNTPYGRAEDAHDDWKITDAAADEANFKHAARAELAFLKSLLPPEEPA